MADIELVIKIPKETYDFLKRYGTDGGIIEKAVLNGILLPKGHGRLIDADAYAKKFDTNINGRIGEEYVIAPTIIEADTESEASE